MGGWTNRKEMAEEPETPPPATSCSRKSFVAAIAAVFVLVGVVGVFISGGVPGLGTEAALAARAAEERRSCTSNSIMVTSKSYGFRLSPDGDTTFVSSDNRPTWTFTKISGGRRSSSATFSIKRPGTSQYVAAIPNNSDRLTLGTGSPANDQYKQWKVSNAGCSSEGNYYYLKNVGASKYMESGFFYPGLTSTQDSNSKFYLVSTSGNTLCSVSSKSCNKLCKTGMQVAWHAFDAPKNSTNMLIEENALKRCNAHCKTCSSWDPYCKSCGGTINKWNSGTTATNKVTGAKAYFRQCDCNSAFKAAGMSLLAVLAVMLNIKLQA